MTSPPATPDRQGDPAGSQGGAPKRRKERRKERRLARHLRHARAVWNNPRSAGDLARAGLLGIWRARGGGLYGLGYLVTFLILEARLVVGELEASEGLMSFLSDQLLEYLLRIGFMSFVNVLLAFLWPLFVLERLGGWGLLLLVVGYFVFERWARPRLEVMIPELGREKPAEEADVSEENP